MAVIGLDLGATKLAGALFDRDGTILERAVTLLEGREGDEVGRLIVERMSALRTVAAARAVERGGGRRLGAGHRAITRMERSGRRTSPGGSGIRLRDVLRAEVGDRARWWWRATGPARSWQRCLAGSRGAAGMRSSWRWARGSAPGFWWTGRSSGVRARHRRRDRLDGPRPALPGGLRSVRRVRVARLRGGHRAGGAGNCLQAEPGYQGALRAIAPEQITAHEVFARFRRRVTTWRPGSWPTRWNAGGWRSRTW